ncbi:TPA: AAA family ATPase [Serratia fonticola]
MRYTINKIQTRKTITNQLIDIDTKGKNLIITGNNGCGKTVFLRRIHAHLIKLIVETGEFSLPQVKRMLENTKNSISRLVPGDAAYEYHQTQLKSLNILLEELKSLKVEINEVDKFKIDYHSGNSFIRFFEATRQASITPSNNISSIPSLIKENDQKGTTVDTGIVFEKYIISFLNYGILSSSKHSDKDESTKVNEWFERVNEDIRDLFEDPSLMLYFDIENLCIKIKQDGKEPYHLNQLSSGYSSILSIYADLLMKVELRKTKRDEITGIVLIDEIDAHLHVSLQRKVFSFFKKSFPNVQFIITTHSPFVVQSVDDAIIYDFGKLEQMEDLSSYSYEAIIKGLLNEKSTSEILENKLKEIGMLASEEVIDGQKLRAALAMLENDFSKLDSRAKAFYLVGQNKLIETEQGK